MQDHEGEDRPGLEPPAHEPAMEDLIQCQEPSAFFENGGMGQGSTYFTSQEQFDREWSRIFSRSWLPVDHVSRLSAPGRFTVVNVANESILLVRTAERIQAFHNFCRHRGLRLVDEGSGARKCFTCPYHRWVYDLDGKLLRQTGMDYFSGFDPSRWGLRPIATAIRGGLVLINLSDEPQPLEDHLGEFSLFVERYRLDSLQSVVEKDYQVASNWKLIMHNINECLHFPSVHADLHRVTDHDTAKTYHMRGNVIGAWQALREGVTSVSTSGRSPRPPMPDVPSADHHRVNWITLLPNLLAGLTTDYVMLQWVWPLRPDRTLVRNLWLFHPSAVASEGFDYQPVFELWDKANYEDWAMCERTHLGVASRYWIPGPYAIDEEVLHDFDRYILRETADERP